MFFTPGPLGHGMHLRPQRPLDLPFVADLYVAHRWEDIRLASGWPDDARS